MKYKSTGTRAGHKIFVRKRETNFDKNPTLKNSSFGDFQDHKEMKTYEYASFQKKVFKEKALQKRRRKIILLVTVIITILILVSLPFIIRVIFNDGVLPLKYID